MEEDEHRAQSYVKVKKLIDEYHKAFIDRVLNEGCLTIENKGNKDSLEEYYESYMSKSNDENVSKTFKEIQENLRSVIAKKLTDDKAYANLFGKNLIESYKDKEEKNKIIDSDLIQFINTAEPSQIDSMSQDEAKELVKEFWGFTTYFVGFFDNRKNMYTSEEKSTGIAYRLVNENLPKFIDNMEAFKKAIAKPEIQANMEELYSNFAEYLNVESIQEMFQLDYYDMLLTQKQIDVYNAIIGGKTDEDHDVKIKVLMNTSICIISSIRMKNYLNSRLCLSRFLVTEMLYHGCLKSLIVIRKSWMLSRTVMKDYPEMYLATRC